MMFVTVHRNKNRLIITDSVTGATQELTLTDEIAAVDEAQGRHYVTTSGLLRSRDGRLIPAQDSMTCRTCNTNLLSKDAVGFCSNCRHITCHPCLNKSLLCPSCARNERKKWFLSTRAR